MRAPSMKRSLPAPVTRSGPGVSPDGELQHWETTMRRLLLFTIAVVVLARPLNAQIAVYDPANTARNSISATIKEYLLETQREQHAQIRRMARRLSAFADLRRFVVLDTPRWRTHG